MRSLAFLALAILLAASSVAPTQEKKDPKDLPPIPTVDLKRKDPVEFSKIGSTSFEYSTGSFRFRSTVGIGGRSLGSFFSCVGAVDDAASRMASARKARERMGKLHTV